jgi:hypothetical protein
MRYHRTQPRTVGLPPGVEATGSDAGRTATGTHPHASALVQPAIAPCLHCRQLPTIAPSSGLLEPYSWMHVCPRLGRRVESSRVQSLTYGEAVRGWNAWCATQSPVEHTEAQRP